MERKLGEGGGLAPPSYLGNHPERIKVTARFIVLFPRAPEAGLSFLEKPTRCLQFRLCDARPTVVVFFSRYARRPRFSPEVPSLNLSKFYLTKECQGIIRIYCLIKKLRKWHSVYFLKLSRCQELYVLVKQHPFFKMFFECQELMFYVFSTLMSDT